MAKQKSTARDYNSEDLFRLLQPQLTTDGELTVESKTKDDAGKGRSYADSEEGLALIRQALEGLLKGSPTEKEEKEAVPKLRTRASHKPRVESTDIKGTLPAPQPQAEPMKQKKDGGRLYDPEELFRVLKPRLTSGGVVTVENTIKDDEGKVLDIERYFAECQEGMAIIGHALGRLFARTPTETEAKNAVIVLRGRGLERPRIESDEIKGAVSAPQPAVTSGPQPTGPKNKDEELLSFLESLFPNNGSGLPGLTPDRKPVIWLEGEEEHCTIPSEQVRAWIFGQSVAKRRRPLTGTEMSAALQWLMALARERGELEVLITDGSGEFADAAADEAAGNPSFLALQQYLRAENVVNTGQYLEVLATDACNQLAYYAKLYHPNAKAFNPDPRVQGKYLRKNSGLLERFVGVAFTSTHREDGKFWKFTRIRGADDFANPGTFVPTRG